MEKVKILKIQIRSTQHVGKVWIRRKKSSRPYLGPSQAIFSMDRKNQKNTKMLPISLGGLPIFLGWQGGDADGMAPIRVGTSA